VCIHMHGQNHATGWLWGGQQKDITMVVKLKAEIDASGNVSRLVAIHYIRRCVTEAMPCKFLTEYGHLPLMYVPHEDENILQ